MIDEIIALRNKIHKDAFRFVLTPDHWKALYMPENMEKSNVATVTKDGRLRGYAAFYLVNFEHIRAYDVRELCAEDENVLAQLIDEITEKGMKDKVDFVFLKRCEEPHDMVFAQKGFSSFLESVIMIALFDPRKLLSSISEPEEKGKVLKLVIDGSDPISIRVGEKGIMMPEVGKSDMVISTDGKTFLKLFFGKTSFLKEFLRRRVKVSSIFGLAIANEFFEIVRHKKWYVPMGDWV